MSGKRAKRARRIQRLAASSADVFDTQPAPRRRNLGWGIVFAAGAAAAAVLAAGMYFFVDSEGPRGNAPPGQPPSGESAALADPFPEEISGAAEAKPSGESPAGASAAGSNDPSASGPLEAPASAKDPPAGAPANSSGLPDDLAEGIRILQQQVRLRPNDGINRAALAGLLEAQGNFDEAEEHYRRAVEAAPDYARVRHDYGMFLARRRQRLDEARSHLRAAADLEPDSAQMHVGLGFIHGESGDMTSAIQQFNRALALDPSHVAAHFYLATALDEVDRWDESAEHYRTVSRLEPGYYSAHYGLGVVLAKQGDFDGALEQFRLTTIAPSPELRRLAEQAIGYLEEARLEMETDQGAVAADGLPPGLDPDLAAPLASE